VADRFLLESSSTDGYLLEDGTGVLLLDVWTPTSPSNTLAAWFVPSTSNCFTNAAGTTAVTADGDTVQSIRTSSGSLIGGNTFSGTYPVYRTGSGKPYLDFTGGDQLQGGTSFTLADGSGRWTAAAAIVPLGTDNQVILNGIGTAVEIVSGDLGGRAVSGGGAFNYRDTSGATTVANTQYVVQTIVSSTTVESSLNGVSDGPGTITNTPPDSSASSFAIGSYSAGVSGFYLYGFVWYQGVLGGSDQAGLASYLTALFPSASSNNISGSAVLTFAPSATLLGQGAVSGSSTLTFPPAATLLGGGAVSGSSSLTFSPSATLLGKGAVSGSSSILFTPSATLLGQGAVSGSSTLTFAPSGAVTGKGALLGSTALTFAPSATLGTIGSLQGVAGLTFSGSSTLLGGGPVSGSVPLTLAGSATLLGAGSVAGSTALSISVSGLVLGRGVLAGSSSLSFALVGDVHELTAVILTKPPANRTTAAPTRASNTNAEPHSRTTYAPKRTAA